MPWVSVYVILVALLHARGHIRVSLLWCAALLAAAALPSPAKPWARRGRALALAAAAAWLLWRQAGLPPASELGRFLTDSTVSPSFGYVMRFLWGCVDGTTLALAGMLLAGAAAAARRRLNMGALGAAALALVFVIDPRAALPARPSIELEQFYAEEARRRVTLSPSQAMDLDVVVVQVCSLSWDDLRAASLPLPAFYGKAQIVLERFNTATSYSNPAALRLLRALCGHSSHGAIFRKPPDECLLLEGLRRGGYRTWAASNHDGDYDDFAKTLATLGGADLPLPNAGLQPALLNFNDSAIYSDWQVLSRWWESRQASGAKRAALYYNSVTLHQGAYTPGKSRRWGGHRDVFYREHAGMLFNDLERFAALLESSGRRGIIVLVPEHGAALEGTPMQPPDLRSTPLPGLTLAPVAVRLFGPRAPRSSPLVVARTTSYIDLAGLLGRLLWRPPFDADAAALQAAAAGITGSHHVAENSGVQVIEDAGRYLLRAHGGLWRSVPRGADRGARLPEGRF